MVPRDREASDTSALEVVLAPLMSFGRGEWMRARASDPSDVYPDSDLLDCARYMPRQISHAHASTHTQTHTHTHTHTHARMGVNMYVHVRMFAGCFFSIFRRHPDFDKLDLYVTKQVIVTFLEDVLKFPRKAPKLQPPSKGSIPGIWAQRCVFASPCTETEDNDAYRKGTC